ncbi:hypothetical protein M011DRAFT_463975 [Sporormia fimetaria CBS 119925]|uniref:RING-type domain-containing protein n=1 Tax=Sporormia fimetaria CBS 119925 TaxID=1340428 RepID=A0A6A6VKX1_9PLEO|nr:hypothetical protein M011DRAFT_463975 [Sporormia fimetaria CBS 119925]
MTETAGNEVSPLLSDLGKELTCSICTELLYQPLTLLDCLHTFCGACLKEWFQFQASTATSIHPYTCPSCRATVQKTQRNALTTTLLESFLKAHPDSGKSEEDKKADREKYKPGDNVLPKLRKRESPSEQDDRRLLEEVQQLSLQEVGITSNAREPPRDRRRRDRDYDASRSSRSHRRDGERSRSRTSPVEPSREIIPPRHIEHQSSLRSLLSASEFDSQEMEEEIMRQIMEEGLLDGIDLNNIDVAQEDEISERIAQAYRNRQEQRRRERRERRERMAREGRLDIFASGTSTPQGARTPLREDAQTRRRGHVRHESGASTPVLQPSRPPISNPALIDAANSTGRARHTRSSSQGSSRSSRRGDRPAALSVSSSRAAASSNSDLGEGSDTRSGRRRRQSDNQHRGTAEERQQFRAHVQAHSSSNPNSPKRMGFNIPSHESPPSSTLTISSPIGPHSTAISHTQPPNARRTTDPGMRHARQAMEATPPLAPPASTTPQAPALSVDDRATAEPPPLQLTASPPCYTEPEISCNSCGREHIRYQLHYNCSHCDQGTYSLCLSCYRAGKGCKHWFGFGWAALAVYERQAPPGGYPPGHELPHVLVGQRYLQPATDIEPTSSPVNSDPAHRLQSGVFCDICQAFANGCYWKCEMCNYGAWGFCNDCVNQGRHCTHSLLPMTHETRDRQVGSTGEHGAPRTPSLAPPADETSPNTPPRTPKTASLVGGLGLVTIGDMVFRPLTFTTLCDNCKYPIPPSHTRYHCLHCNKGDYDLCTSCYHKLVASGRISKEDGMNGWRRCPRGHRMIVVGFEDRGSGQRRVVVRDLVGGWALRDEPGPSGDEVQARSPTGPKSSWIDADGSVHKYRTPNSSAGTGNTSYLRFPPDGGMGLRVQANWSYFPDEGVTDELGFPRNAEIREAEDVNGDWFWGVYAGAKGLFPGNYVKVVGSS